MATTAAERATGRVLAAAAALLLMAACIRTEPPEVLPAPAPVAAGAVSPPPPEASPPPAAPEAESAGQPSVRVGLEVGAGAVTIAGGGGATVRGPGGDMLAVLSAGETAVVSPGGSGVRIALPGGTGTSVPSVTVEPRRGSAVRVDGREYWGTLLLLPDRTGLTVVNTVGLEDYVAAVVASEMGRRDSREAEALRAQAVVSRTYALRNMGRWRDQGFDLYATVADQAYGGIGAETPLAREAAEATRGEVVTYGGAPIDAFFFSTCGGRTATGTEVFRAADRPYLQSVSDIAPDGLAYCRGSPRFHWTEVWTGDELGATLAQTVPAVLGLPDRGGSTVSNVRVVQRSASDRVARLEITLNGRAVTVEERQVRQVLRSPSGGMLRSAAFTLSADRARGGIIRLEADGVGAGHGVGFCQWGAVGRARMGQGYRQIVAAYYPGTSVQRLY